MQRPLFTNPMMQLLALRAYATAHPRLGTAVQDVWCGSGFATARALGDNADRVPAAWTTKWPEAVRLAFWSHRQAAASREVALPDLEPADIVACLLKRSAVPSEAVTFGVLPAALETSTFSSLRAIGLVAEPIDAGVGAEALEAFARAKGIAPQVWWEIPASRVVWERLRTTHLALAHRLGVSLWLHPPSTAEDWPAYAEALSKVTSLVARHPQWEQWVWPICDLLQQCQEDILLYGRPVHRDSAPWFPEGKSKPNEWLRVRRQVWATWEKVLGGIGGPEEILVATILAHEKLLLDQGESR